MLSRRSYESRVLWNFKDNVARVFEEKVNGAFTRKDLLDCVAQKLPDGFLL